MVSALWIASDVLKAVLCIAQISYTCVILRRGGCWRFRVLFGHRAFQAPKKLNGDFRKWKMQWIILFALISVLLWTMGSHDPLYMGWRWYLLTCSSANLLVCITLIYISFLASAVHYGGKHLTKHIPAALHLSHVGISLFVALLNGSSCILVLSTEKKIYAVIRHVANMVAGVGAGIIFLGTLFNILKVLEETEDDAELCRKIDMSRSSSPARSRRSRRRRGSRRSDKSAHSSNVEIDGASEDASPGSSSRSRSPVATNSRSQSPVSLSGPRSSSNSPSSRRKWTRKLPNSTKRIHIMTLPQKKIKLPIVDERASLERVDERASPLSMETVSSRNSSNSLAHEKHSEPLYGEEVGDSKASLNGDLETTNAALVTRPGTRTSAGSSSGVASDSAVSSLSNADLIKSVKEKPDSRGSASAGRDSESLASDRKLLVSLGALVAEEPRHGQLTGRAGANRGRQSQQRRAERGRATRQTRASQRRRLRKKMSTKQRLRRTLLCTSPWVLASFAFSTLAIYYNTTGQPEYPESIEEERCKYDFMYDLLYWVHLGFLGYMQHWGRIEENHHANNEHHRPGRGK